MTDPLSPRASRVPEGIEQLITEMRQVHETCVTRCNRQMDAERAKVWADRLAALAASEATQERVDPRWKGVACLFHDALVGANNAGMYNQRLATEAVRLLDAVMAHEGSGRADDNAPLLARIEQCSCGLFSEDRYEPLAASEARQDKKDQEKTDDLRR